MSDNHIRQGCGWNEEEVKAVGQTLNSHHVIPLEDYDGNWYKYPDERVVTLCDTCHGVSEYQDGKEKWPVNGRGEEARLLERFLLKLLHAFGFYEGV
jgi:5-methylcytosine-specific restriction endonuclease McrA